MDPVLDDNLLLAEEQEDYFEITNYNVILYFSDRCARIVNASVSACAKSDGARDVAATVVAEVADANT